MSSMSETSFWINFFTTAGIPAGDAAHYAVMFSDNRITKDMLLDLSKEYLTDMGISRLGDVIAILKHAKHVYNQEARDKVLRSTSLTSLSSSNSFLPVNTPRRSTAASRMVNQITSKHPEAGPMSQSPIPKLPPPDPPRPRRKVSVFERLGADGVEDTVILSSDLGSLSSPSSVFSRLGGQSALKRAASSTSFDDADTGVRGADGLPYAGVLKSGGGGPPSAKKANIKMSISTTKNRTAMKIKKTIKNSIAEERKASQIQRPEVSTTTEGVLSDFAKKDTPSLKDRLGSKSETPSSTSGSTPRVTPASSRPGRARILDRLGTKEDSSVVSSTELTTSKMNMDKTVSKATDGKKTKGVFSRLALPLDRN